MSAPEEVVKLIERFGDNIEAYKSGGYGETQVRIDFINPFFKALGWDIDNTAGHAEAYKDVIHEDSIKIGGTTKAPDYSFRIGGMRKFFLEAKKPSVNIKVEPGPAFQTRRYAWSAKLPVSILTDFEEFAVYDCRVKPVKTDKASTARVLYCTYNDYEDKWDEIEEIFSKEAVLKGSFDKYAESYKKKRGTAEVDSAFLKEIESWRESLAKNIALRNSLLSQRGLNFSVQRIIDRIIFLRISEDRGIEPPNRLKTLQNGTNIYERLCQYFQQADDKYNSGLFHFRKEKDRGEPDELTLRLKLDDKPLKEIFKHLYYPDSPYEFSVLPADILGQVYEQFLGKVIRLTSGHQAKIEDKPEVKKAGGVYYTPTYIVDYIVKNTVGKLCERRTPKKVEKLRILDPACGSGSFLLGAYQYLLDWHTDWYVKKGPGKHKKQLYQAQGGEWRLTTAERKRILLNNIYGVDIDSQAVETTKLSLLLKVLEGENEETISKQLKTVHERALPDLGNNIKCGNSLIGPDFYEGKQLTMLDDEEQYRVNAFDWNSEFKGIMKGGGFNAVIGNPPYIRIQNLKEWAPLEVEFYKDEYTAAKKGNYDIYVVFVERGLSLLNKNGRLGFILPHKFFNAKYGEALRGIIAKGKHLADVVHFGDQQVFANATTYTCLMFLDKKGNKKAEIAKIKDLNEWINDGKAEKGNLKASFIDSSEWNFVVGKGSGIFRKLSGMTLKLGDFVDLFVGLQTSADTVFLFKKFKTKGLEITTVYSKELDRQVDLESALLKPVIRSGSIGRYWGTSNILVLFPYKLFDGKSHLLSEKELRSKYPKTWSYLISNKRLLSNREHGKFANNGWYQLYPKNLDVWEQSKIMMPYMVTRLSAFFDNSANYFVNVTTGGFGITIRERCCHLKYLTGLLNSGLLNWYFKNVSTNFHGGYFAANKQYLAQLPIRTINFKNKKEKAQHDKMVSLADSMLSFNKKLAETKTAHGKKVIERQIDATDSQIDKLVYKLYDLTDDEIKIVEESL